MWRASPPHASHRRRRWNLRTALSRRTSQCPSYTARPIRPQMLEGSCVWAPQGHRQGCGRLHRQTSLCHDLTLGPHSIGAAMLSSRKTARQSIRIYISREEDLRWCNRGRGSADCRQPGSTLNRALLLLNMHNTCSRPGVAQVRCCATLYKYLCCRTVAQLLQRCRTAATSIALTYTITDLMVQHTTLYARRRAGHPLAVGVE